VASANEVIGRVVTDPTFAVQLGADPAGALAGAGYSLDAAEQAKVMAWMTSGSAPAIQARLQAATLDHHLSQMQRARALQTETLELFSGTLGSAKKTYSRVTLMNQILFGFGLALFALAAGWGVFADQKVYSIVFGGLGTAAFVAVFLTGPIEKTQAALSNLVQGEIAFMNFFEQITMWESYAMAGPAAQPAGQPGGPPAGFDPARIEKASSMLQKRAAETMSLLQKYLEPGAASVG
jgi:hypothetical protein